MCCKPHPEPPQMKAHQITVLPYATHPAVEALVHLTQRPQNARLESDGLLWCGCDEWRDEEGAFDGREDGWRVVWEGA